MYYARKPAYLIKIRKAYGKTVQVDGFDLIFYFYYYYFIFLIVCILSASEWILSRFTVLYK